MKLEETNMHLMNPTSLFFGRATDYANYRPSYPPEAITSILDGLCTTLGIRAKPP